MLANYEKEQAAFARLWQSRCQEPILFFCGEPGSGKTTLLRTCHKAAPDDVYQVFIDCKSDGTNVADIFCLTADRVGRKNMPKCSQYLEQHYQVPMNVDIGYNLIKGDSNQINVIFNNSSEQEEKELRTTLLADNWLQDIQQLDRPLLLVLDTYEKAGQDIRIWLNKVINRLPYACFQLRIAVAGQLIPAIATNYCCKHALNGVPEPKKWLSVIKDRGFRVPAEHPLSYLACLCDYTKGSPGQISSFIETFPRLP